MARSVLAAVLVSLVCAGASASSPSVAAPAATNPTFVLFGHGWGHGIGMSQYGAYGFAEHGFDYTEILAHYYTGTTLGPAPVSKVRVLLAQGRASLSIRGTAPLKLTDGAGKTRTLPAGTYPVGAGPSVRLDPAKAPVALTGPLVFASTTAAPLALGGVRYRGTLQVSAAGGRLQAVNAVGVDPYVQGVVSREMPSSWPEEALKVQAVAARSYGLANRKVGGSFDLYADTRSQVYGGVAAETPSTNAAATATAGEVVLFEDKVANTLFSSTSGGRTASIEDAWPTSEPVPYLVSVPDPYDTLSPYHDWAQPITAAFVAGKLRVPGRLTDLGVTVNPSARVTMLTAVGTFGKVAVTGRDARTLLGLRSSWFRVGVLGQPTAKVQAITFGSKLKLSGVARSVPKLALQSRPPGAAWTVLAPLKPGAGGAVSYVVQPKVTTEYRFGSGATGGQPTRIAVAARVRFYARDGAGHLRGYGRPVVPGAPVQVQRLAGTAWTTVATSSLDASGVFDASLDLTPGTYRARLAPGHGLVAGYTPPLQVGARR